MSVYMVTYDLNAPGQDYSTLIKEIGKFTHCKALKSAFFIDSAKSASEIRDHLMKFVDPDDMLFVLELRWHWGANRVSPATDWLQDKNRTWS